MGTITFGEIESKVRLTGTHPAWEVLKWAINFDVREQTRFPPFITITACKASFVRCETQLEAILVNI